MVGDIRLATGWIDHVKTRLLIDECGHQGALCLIRLWCYAAEHHPRGVFPDKRYIEKAADWKGKRGKFFDALVSIRWLESDGVTLHDWGGHQPWVFTSLERSEVARASARVAGVASAAARKELYGTAQPMRRTAPERSVERSAERTPNGPERPSPSPSPSPSPLPSPSKQVVRTVVEGDEELEDVDIGGVVGEATAKSPPSGALAPLALVTKPPSPLKRLSNALKSSLGASYRTCEAQIVALRNADWSDEAIERAIVDYAKPGIAPWDWTKQVTGRNGTSKGMSARDILAWGRRKTHDAG